MNIITALAFVLLSTTTMSVDASGYLRSHVDRQLSVDIEDLFEGTYSYENSDNVLVDSFLGIQYATYSERFEPSELVELPTNGTVIDTTEYGDWCVQTGPILDANKELPMSEECLYLNIWRPSTANASQQEDALLPVMVFIHGGSFFFGSGAMYDGSNLAGNENVIVVTINYRLGIFGYLPMNNEGTGGMNGILDQVRALEWVQNYIHLFGGNKDLVTAFGESAGGQSISALSVSPIAQGLFQRAIVESGMFGVGCQSVETFEDLINNVLEETNSTITGLKNLEMEALLQFESSFSSPICDPAVLPNDISTLYAEGKIHPTDMIIGTNTYDDVDFPGEDFDQLANSTSIKDSPWWGWNNMDKWDGYQQQAAIDAYSNDKYNGSNAAAIVQFEADVELTCPNRAFAEIIAENINGSVYNYVFGYLSEWDDASTSGFLKYENISNPDWTSHGSEIFFVFGIDHLYLGGPNGNYQSVPFSGKDKRLNKMMQERWGNFAWYGTPVTTNQNDDKWIPVKPAMENNATAADPNYLLFTGNGSTAIQSDKNKMEQCSAIYVPPVAPKIVIDGKESSSGVAMKTTLSWMMAAIVLGSMLA